MIEQIEAILGYHFNNPRYLATALTLSEVSASMNFLLESFERQQYLGQAVIKLCIREWVILNVPSTSQEKITEFENDLESRKRMIRFAGDLELQTFLHFGAEVSDIGYVKQRTADFMEALFGAIYLDGGFSASQKVFKKCIEPLLRQSLFQGEPNWIHRLRELIPFPEPVFVHDPHPPHYPHHLSSFSARLCYLQNEVASGFGFSKKDAEQEACRLALLNQDWVAQMQIELADRKAVVNYKGQLFEFLSTFAVTPTFTVVKEEGPSHAKHYVVEVYLNNKVFGIGSGNSKKMAEHEAARVALLVKDRITQYLNNK